QDGASFSQRFAKCRAGGDLERKDRRIDVVIGAVDQCGLDVDNREAGKTPRPHDAVNTLFDAGNKFLRHGAADDLALEARALARLVRLEDDLDPGELAGTAGLLLVDPIDHLAAR